ncbi:hypothetical protein B296_00055645, partial [Ensete ventricosum]
MKSDGSVDSGLAAPSTASASPTVEVVVSTAEKHPGTDKEDKVGANGYFTSIIMRPSPGEGEEPLKLRWSSIPGSAQGLHFALIDRVHDAGRLVRQQHKRITTFRVANKELKLRANQEAIAAIENRANELQATVDRLRAELDSSESRRKGLEQEVDTLRSNLQGVRDDRAHLEGDVLSLTKVTTLLEAELKAEGPEVVAAYKASREFKLGLEKMGRTSYEFGYRVVLKRLRAKLPKAEIEQDPFTKHPVDSNMKMDLCQPSMIASPYEKVADLVMIFL